MKLPDNRRIRISASRIIDGGLISIHAADAWQEPDGTLTLSGLWSGIVPFSPEDHEIVAARAGVSSLEWLYQRLLMCPTLSMEIFD